MRQERYEGTQCIFCKSVYNKTIVWDDGLDWMGHQRGRYSSQVVEDECPYCHGDVREAVKILDSRTDRQDEFNKRVSEENLTQSISIDCFSLGNSISNMFYADSSITEGIYYSNSGQLCEVKILEQLDLQNEVAIRDTTKIPTFMGTKADRSVKAKLKSCAKEHLAKAEYDRAIACISAIKYLEVGNYKTFRKIYERRVI